jgi:hypothetical protein
LKPAVTSTSLAAGLYGISFTVGDLSEIASFTSIYDQYRIPRVELFIKPATQLAAPSASPSYSFLYIVNDFDDVVPLATSDLALNYSNCTIIGPGQSHHRSIVPAVNATSGASGTTYQTQLPAPWLDCADTSVVHYGFKLSVTQSTSTNVNNWSVWCKYHVQFRGVR